MIYAPRAGTKLFAAIGVTYPEGSALTCTNGSTTLKAKTTSGQWVFAVPKAGTWTVAITSGTKTMSKSVSITTEGQFNTLSLAYEILLFDGANDVTAESGGWEKYSGDGTITVADGLINLSQVKGSGTTVKDGIFRHKTAVNMTDFNTLTVNTGSISTYVDNRCQIRVYNASNEELATVTLKKGTTEYSLDISEITGNCYVAIRFRSFWDGSTHTATSMTVSEVKLSM